MLASKIACPNCRTGFQTASALAPGQKLKCPKCGAYFTVPAQSGRLTRTPPPRSQPANADTKSDLNLSQPRTREDSKPNQGTRRASLRVKPGGSPTGGSKVGAVLLVLLVLVLLAGGIVTIYFVVNSRHHGGRASGVNPEARQPEARPPAPASAGAAASKEGEPKGNTGPDKAGTKHVLVTSETAVPGLPAAVTDAVKKNFPGFEIQKAERLTNSRNDTTGYTLQITNNKSEKEIDVTPGGTIFGER